MKTTLECFCDAVGWQGGTIHQARERFAVASQKEMDKICGYLSANISDISDPREALYFTNKRMEAIGLHCVAAYTGN